LPPPKLAATKNMFASSTEIDEMANFGGGKPPPYGVN